MKTWKLIVKVTEPEYLINLSAAALTTLPVKQIEKIIAENAKTSPAEYRIIKENDIDVSWINRIDKYLTEHYLYYGITFWVDRHGIRKL